ncbi:MAG: DUF5682 family protein [Pseudomonadota bacterium]
MTTTVAEDAKPHLFGIRHHGPGCARSLLRALEALQPDCLLVEGPPEAEDQLKAIVQDGMEPPVALLSYCPDDSALAVYHPFAVFSPEWQALRWAVQRGVPVRFIDLPLAHGLALEQQRRAEDAAAPSVIETEEPAAEEDTQAEEGAAVQADPSDPLGWLARAAGYADGESWWNHMVEERGDGEELFAAIQEAMVTVRQELGGKSHRDEAEMHREALREAHMRQCLREARKAGHERIAVVCGAWHLGALQAEVPAKADQQLLKGLPKVKVATTWIPWTYRHLSRASGYGAGIAAPGWYEHLWASGEAGGPRTIGWLARVARLMRDKDLDCSSAHLIEAARLADSLAAMRQRPLPGLEELNEATRSVLCMGDDTVLRWIEDELVVGDRLGAVPPDVPAVPLQRDLEQAQKSLRLKAEATSRTLDLDLRQPNDLARSRLLHRLGLLDVPWGEIARAGRSSRGTFHEVWTLQWKPEFALRLIEASRWGRTVLQAATANVIERAGANAPLDALARLVDQVLLAELPEAVRPVTDALERSAATSGDTAQLLAALPPLANVFRYGNVRQTDASLVAHVVDGIVVRAAIGLPLACCALDDTAAQALRQQLLAAHAAVGLRDAEAQTEAWRRALGLVAQQQGVHPLLAGVACRLLLDAGTLSADDAARALGLQLSRGADPAHAAAWIDGFLNRNALVLLHDATVWGLIDRWLAALSDEHFLAVLPLVRRTFSAFDASERRDLAGRARSTGAGTPAAPVAVAVEWDAERAALPVPLLRELLGLTR